MIDVEHEEWAAAYHQHWVIIYAGLFSVTAAIAFAGPHLLLFGQAGIFLMLCYEHRDRRNRARNRLARHAALEDK